ncbi:MAG: radical SAM protein [Vicinamibacteria bacterium]
MKPGALRLLVMHVSTRCDQTCEHCSIWKQLSPWGKPLTANERLALLTEARALGATSVLFTGGEPLLCDHIEELSRQAHRIGLAVQIATNGLGLARHAGWIAAVVSEVYVSLDGPRAVHDLGRGASMFDRLQASLAPLVSSPTRPRIIGRSVLSSRNAAALKQTVAAAREIGLDGLSFLPVDTTSGAFGGEPDRRTSLDLSDEDLMALRAGILALDMSQELGGFVLETRSKLTSMADGFVRSPSHAVAPRCDAPEWSSVIEADGSIRPCFFQPTVLGTPALRLGEVRQSLEYAGALSRLGPSNPTCKRCVCPKYVGDASLSGRVLAAVGRRWAALRQPGENAA